MSSTGKACIICREPLTGDYFHRAQCGHHECLLCAIPKIRAGKNFCIGCPSPRRPDASGPGNLVLGYDSEQNLRISAQLLAERYAAQVRTPVSRVLSSHSDSSVCV
jgi:hypothetical protein